MDLLSSGDVALMMGQVPCEFRLHFSAGGSWSIWPSRLYFPGMVIGTCHLQGRQPLPWGRSPVNFGQISQTSFFSRWLLMWFGTFTRTCTAPQGMVVGTCHLQGRQPLPWERSPVSFGQISLGVVFQGKSWDKGPSSLALIRMVHHPW